MLRTVKEPAKKYIHIDGKYRSNKPHPYDQNGNVYTFEHAVFRMFGDELESHIQIISYRDAYDDKLTVAAISSYMLTLLCKCMEGRVETIIVSYNCPYSKVLKDMVWYMTGRMMYSPPNEAWGYYNDIDASERCHSAVLAVIRLRKDIK